MRCHAEVAPCSICKDAAFCHIEAVSCSDCGHDASDALNPAQEGNVLRGTGNPEATAFFIHR